MSTEISEFRAPIRALIGDGDPDVPLWSDYQIDQAVKLVVNTGKVAGYSIDDEDITPTLEPSTDTVTAYATLLYRAAKLLTAPMVDSRFSTRAFTEQLRAPRELVSQIIGEIYSIENGDMAE